MRSPARVAATACVVACGCAATPTQVLVRVEAEPAVTTQAHTLCVEIQSEILPAQRQCERVAGADAAAMLPTEVPVLRGAGSTGFRFQAELYDAAQAARLSAGETAVPFVTHRADVAYVTDELVTVVITMEDACIGVACPDEQTCVSGGCSAVPLAVPVGRE